MQAARPTATRLSLCTRSAAGAGSRGELSLSRGSGKRIGSVKLRCQRRRYERPCANLENRYTSSRRVEGSNPSPSAHSSKSLQRRHFSIDDAPWKAGPDQPRSAQFRRECRRVAQRADRTPIAQTPPSRNRPGPTRRSFSTRIAARRRLRAVASSTRARRRSARVTASWRSTVASRSRRAATWASLRGAVLERTGERELSSPTGLELISLLRELIRQAARRGNAGVGKDHRHSATAVIPSAHWPGTEDGVVGLVMASAPIAPADEINDAPPIGAAQAAGVKRGLRWAPVAASSACRSDSPEPSGPS
jgi:hypothetical protein